MKKKVISAVGLVMALMLLAGCSFDNYIVPGTDRRAPKKNGGDVLEASAGEDVILPPVEYDDSLGELVTDPKKDAEGGDAKASDPAAPGPEGSAGQTDKDSQTAKAGEDSSKVQEGQSSAPSDGSQAETGENNGLLIPDEDETVSMNPNLSVVHAAPEEFDKTSVKSFVTGGDDWFKDALFIGDSRFVGLNYYGNIEGAYWFVGTGMSVFNMHNAPVEVEGIGSISFADLMSLNQFSKIYINLGINECGYGTSAIKEEFGKLLDVIKRFQPNAPIFLQANIHLAAARSDTDSVYNNKKLNAINEAIASYADNIQVFYVNVNEIFDDERGYLKKEYTADSTHIFAKYYPRWTQFLKEHAIQ